MNDLSSNPMALDTPTAYVPGAGPTQPAVLWRDFMNVDHFELVGYSAGAQTAVIKDRNGKVVGKLSTTATDLEEKRTGRVNWIQGLCLDTLASGQILVFLR